jgi:hypothetical protein
VAGAHALFDATLPSEVRTVGTGRQRRPARSSGRLAARSENHLLGSGFAEEFPEAGPWSIELEPDGDIKLAGLVSLKEVQKALRGFDARARWRQRALKREGRHKATEQPGAK